MTALPGRLALARIARVAAVAGTAAAAAIGTPERAPAQAPPAESAALAPLLPQAPTPTRAQAPAPTPPRAPALVRIGKWATLGLAAGLTAMGAVSHDRADRTYASLLDYCRTRGPCPIGADGRYGNPGAEAIYQRVREDDRAARAWLAGGQVALVGSAVLFILELKTRREPENIPFAPYLETGRFGTLVGVRVGAFGER